MKWWQMALIVSLVWIGLCIGSAYLFFPAGSSPEQDSKLSEMLGEACGAGLVAVWVIVAWVYGKIGTKKT